MLYLVSVSIYLEALKGLQVDKFRLVLGWFFEMNSGIFSGGQSFGRRAY